MKPTIFDGVVYNKEAVTELRSVLIRLRDATLMNNNFKDAVTLSHLVAFLAFIIEEIES